MAPEGDGKKLWWSIKRKEFYNHSVNALTSNAAVYCIWETKEGLTTKGFRN